MKKQLTNTLIALILLVMPALVFAQAPPLGTAAEFTLFSTVGAVGNSGISQITGNVGTNSGSSTGFGNVNGVMNDNNGASAQCAADLLIAYNQLNSTVPTFFPAPLLGNGQILNAGVYSIPSPSTLNLDITLDAQGDPSAVFIFQIQGSFSTSAGANVKLVNGALACNVFWKVEGLVSMAPGTIMRGTIIANNAAIEMNTGTILEGRALSTAGAVTVDGVLAYTPIGCGSAVLTGPLAPTLASVACYALFTSDGPASNVGVTNVIGDVGSNNGLTTGYNPLFVMGTVHPIPDGSTVQAASDLLNAYNYLNALPYDIELLYPAQFGNSLVLTPHTYILNGATTFTDTLYLNAQGDANAIFVIQIKGALSTSTYSKVSLINGTQSKNVYWAVDGAVDINDYSEFVGTIVCNNGAISLNTGVILDGRALTTTGALATSAVTANIPTPCSPIIPTEPVNQTVCVGSSVSFSVAATGVMLTYQWRRGTVDLVNGGSISGATSDTLTINPVTMSDAASDYNVVIIGDYAPSDTSINVSLVVNMPPNVTAQAVNPACSYSPNGGIVLNGLIANGTGYMVDYTGATSGTLSNQTASGTGSIDIADLLPGNYNIIVTDANGCSASSSTIITQPIALTANIINVVQPTCNNGVSANDGSAAIIVSGGIAPYSYQWTGGNTTALLNNLPSGTYSVTVTDFNNCSLIIDNALVLIEPDCCTANASGILDKALCEGDITANNNLSFLLEPYGLIYGPEPTPATDYSLSYVLTDNSGSILQLADMGAPFNTASNIPNFTYSTLPSGLYRIYEIIWRTTDGPLTGTNIGNNVANIDVTNPISNCLAAAFGTLSINANPTANASSNTPICVGEDLNLTATGGVSYVWTTTAVTPFSSIADFNIIPNATVDNAGTYTVTITDINGCTANASTTVIVNESTATITPLGATTFCQGENVVLMASGGGTYLWSNGETTDNITVNTSDTYTVTVTDNGCTSTATTTIITNSLPNVSSPIITPNTNCTGIGNGSIDITVSGGTLPYTFVWSNAATTEDISNLNAATYTVTVTTNNGCSAIGSATVVNGATLPNVSATTVDNTNCTGIGNGSINITVSGGTLPYTFVWSNAATTEDISNLNAATYTVTVTTNNGCSVIGSATVVNGATLPNVSATTVDNTNCTGIGNGSIDITVSGGTLPYTFVWSNAATTEDISNLNAATYTVTVTTNNGCSVIGSATVVNGATSPNLSATTVDNTNCTGIGNGSINITVSGGTLPYTFVWSNAATTEDISNLNAATYTVTVTTNNGCSAIGSATVVNGATLPNVSATTVDNTNCTGIGNGSINITVSGGTLPYTFVWSNAATTEDISNLNAATYTVTVTTNNGCSVIGSATVVNGATLPNLSATVVDNTNCTGIGNGSINITVSGGTLPYTFVWSNAATTEDISNLNAATYTVTVTANNGCSVIGSATVVNGATSPNLSATTVDNTNCTGIGNGSIDITVSGGTLPYTFVWSNAATTEDISNLNAATYTVTVTTNNGCSVIGSATVANGATLPNVSATTVDNTNCTGIGNGSINITVSGGTLPYTFVWSNAATTEDISNLNAATYTVTVTTNNGCSAIGSATVVNGATLPNLSATVVDNTNCTGIGNGSINITVSGGTLPYTFVWSNAATTEDISNLNAATYTVTVTTNNGCSVIGSATVVNGATLPNLSANIVDNTNCTGIGNGSINITVSGGTLPYTFVWSNAATTEDISNLNAATYTVTVTTNNGCSAIGSATVVNGATLPTANINQTNTILTCNTPSITLVASGGSNYLWNAAGGNSTSATISVAAADTYIVTVTNTSGCTATASVVITSNTTKPTSPTAIIANVLCNGAATGAINIAPIGGIAPYSFIWSNGASTEDIADLTVGTYSVTVSGANGCNRVASFSVTQPLPLLVVVQTTATCADDAVGTISLTPSGGTSPYTYELLNATCTTVQSSNSTGNFNNLAAGNYCVQVRDVNNCVFNQSGITIASITSQPILISSENTDEGIGGISPFGYNKHVIVVEGGILPYTLVWDNSGYVRYNIEETATGAIITIYYTDDAIWEVSISSICIIAPIVIDNNPDNGSSIGEVLDIYNYNITTANTFNSGSIQLFVEGGEACAGNVYYYEWTTPTGNTINTSGASPTTLSNQPSGWYSVLVTDCGNDGIHGNADDQETIGWYWIPKQIRGRGKADVANGLQVSPNPFNGLASVEFYTAKAEKANITVYATDGKKVAVLFDAQTKANETQSVVFNADNLAAGVYAVILSTESGVVETFKTLIVR